MRGSLLITYYDTDGFGGNYYRVTVNGEIRTVHYSDITGLYSTYIYLGDVVTITAIADVKSSFSITRTDYTTDDVNGDDGIKNTLINTSRSSSVTFTATTVNTAYGFEYKVDLDLATVCYDFFSGTTAAGNPTYTEVQSDGKLLVYGNIGNYKGVTMSYGVMRLRVDGSIDTNFQTNFNAYMSGRTTSNFNSLLFITSDDKIIIGNFRYIYRFNNDGTIDNTWFIGDTITGPSYIESMKELPNGQFILGGGFTSYTSNSVTSSKRSLVKLNNDGTIDTTFNSGGVGFSLNVTGSTSAVNVEIQSDSKILIGGQFNSYNGTSCCNIIRLNSNGSIDTSFTLASTSVATGFTVNDMEIQSDGKILVGIAILVSTGSTISYLSNSVGNVFRLNSNGTLDNTFTQLVNTTTANGKPISEILLLPDDTYLIAGFSQIITSGYTFRGIEKYDKNGVIDASFNVGQTGCTINSSLSSITKINDEGNLVINGPGLRQYNGSPSPTVVRNQLYYINSVGQIINCNPINENTSFLFFASTTSTGAPNDFISYNDSVTGTTLFRYNSVSVTFEDYLNTRINNGFDRMTLYTHNICQDKDLITYLLNYPQGAGQTSAGIGAFFAHPSWMGTIDEIGGPPSVPTPAGGRTSNPQGSFTYNGVQYKLYKFLPTQSPGSTYTRKVTVCS